MKKRIIRGLFVSLLLCSLLLVACTDPKPTGTETGSGDTETVTEAANAGYSVTVADYFGNGMKDVIVKILQEGEIVSMKPTSEEGKTVFKLEDSEYGVELDFSDEASRAAFDFDTTGLKLTPEAPALTVTLYNKLSGTESVQGYSYERDATVPCDAYKVSAGAYRLTGLSLTDRSYFLFRPSRAGIYRVRVISDARFEFGYYGGNLNGSKDTLLPVENKTVELEIRGAYIGDSESTTTPYLIGVMPKSEGVTDCLLVIERVGDPPFSPVDVEWKTVLPTQDDLKRINYLNWSFSDFTALDLTASASSVFYNESDGLYHWGAADGPVVYIRIRGASGHLGEDGTLFDAADKSQFGALFYDEDGNFLYKETYNALIFAYAEICDPINGACPLTQQLLYVMESMGAWKGWFDPDSDGYLFEGVEANSEMMPYFACGYYKTVTPNTGGTAQTPIKLNTDTNGAILLQKGSPLYLTTGGDGLTFEILDQNGDLKVTCNGKTYVAVDGKITLPVSAANTEIIIEIRSESTLQSFAAVIVEITD